jgi:Spy/CpxP family protein refolding chaperone
MKLTLIAPLALTAALALTPFVAGAQTQTSAPTSDAAMTRPRHMPDADHQLRHMTKRLNLTDAQQQQIKPILVDRDNQIAAIRNDTSLTPEQQHSSMGKLMRESASQIRNVLTDSQREQWDASREKMRERRQGKMTPAEQPAPTTPPAA